jgi:hypothetical protein
MGTGTGVYASPSRGPSWSSYSDSDPVVYVSANGNGMGMATRKRTRQRQRIGSRLRRRNDLHGYGILDPEAPPTISSSVVLVTNCHCECEYTVRIGKERKVRVSVRRSCLDGEYADDEGYMRALRGGLNSTSSCRCRPAIHSARFGCRREPLTTH